MNELQRIDAHIHKAIMAFLLEHAHQLLAPDGRCMVWHDGRPIVCDVIAAREMLARLQGKA